MNNSRIELVPCICPLPPPSALVPRPSTPKLKASILNPAPNHQRCKIETGIARESSVTLQAKGSDEAKDFDDEKQTDEQKAEKEEQVLCKPLYPQNPCHAQNLPDLGW